MRSNAIETCAKLLASAVEQKNYQAAEQYAVKLRILTNRKGNDASVIREMMNQ